jgi:uncharacterized protein (TIGR02246 family)
MTGHPAARSILALTHESDVKRIRALWTEYAAALCAGEIDRWISLWSPGGIEMQPAGLRLSGIDQIRAANQPVIDLFDIEITLSTEEVRILGNSAYSYGDYRLALTPKEGGESIRNAGMFLAILERQANGCWIIAITCFNTS